MCRKRFLFKKRLRWAFRHHRNQIMTRKLLHQSRFRPSQLYLSQQFLYERTIAMPLPHFLRPLACQQRMMMTTCISSALECWSTNCCMIQRPAQIARILLLSSLRKMLVRSIALENPSASKLTPRSPEQDWPAWERWGYCDRKGSIET